MLGGWGQPGPTDLDGDGVTDGTDLALLLSAWGPCPKPSPTTLAGIVMLADGTAVADALVVSDLGGMATSDLGGAYELTLALVGSVDSVAISATATIGDAPYQGSTLLAPVAIGAVNAVDPIVMAPDAADCEGGFGWLPSFSSHGLNERVYAMAVFDDGSGTGPALYAGGVFTNAGGVDAGRIAKWTGTFWSPVGGGMDGWVRALTVFDDGSGSGPALYAAGGFATAGGVAATRIARWHGDSWSPLGTGMNNWIYALAVFDDGTGPALYAGGTFTVAGGVPANRVARWDGSTWSPLGNGMGDGGVHALAVFDDGAGPALFAGGTFTTADGVSAPRIARWDGTSWSSLGTGMNNRLRAMAVFDDGAGPALFATGRFDTAGGVSANRIAKWEGTSWSPLGSGLGTDGGALAVFDDGSGPALHVGGSFSTAGGISARGLAAWDGTSWRPLGSGIVGSVNALTSFDDGSGPALYVGGTFNAAGGVQSANIAVWGCTD